MNVATIAKKLNISASKVKKESTRDFLEKKLLETKTELFALANKYGVKSIREFDRLIKKGAIHETAESREDFFKLDYLESKIDTLKRLLGSLK